MHFEAAATRGPDRAAAAGAAPAVEAAPLSSSSARLQYHGGLVESEPRLVLVFMGSQWEGDTALRQELEATAQSLPGSAYQAILTQYSGLYGPISSPLAGSPVVETYYDRRAIAGEVSSIEAIEEGDEVIQLSGAGKDTNAIYAVLPAPGSAEVEEFICGFHTEYGGSGDLFTPGPSIAAIMDTQPRSGCNPSKTITHEYAESVTNPSSSGWNTGTGSEDEIADICNYLGPGRLADGALVAWLWDDSKDACEIEDENPEPVPIGPYTETSRGNPSLEGSTNESVESEALETTIYPCGLQAHYYFEYGTTTAYGARTPEAVVPAAWGPVKVSATISGLEHSTPYHWRVVVTSSNGAAEGGDHEFTIPYYVEVQEELASEVGFSEATLNGEVQPAGVEAGYFFEYGATEAYGSSTAVESAGSGSSFVKVSAPITGLEPGRLYHFRIVASSSRGTTVGADKTFSTHGGKPVAKTLPARSIRYTEAVLAASVDTKYVPTTFCFEYGTTSEYGKRTVERSAGARVTATISGLASDTTYHFRVLATNSYGTSYGADESFSTGPEPLVETEVPEAVGYRDATLDGTVDPLGTEVGYYFEYGTTQSYGLRTTTSSAGAGATGAQEAQTVSGLAEGATYHFRMVATNSYGTTYGVDRTFTTGVQPPVQSGGSTETVPAPPLVESIVTPPDASPPPIMAPAPSPTPAGPQRGPSLRVVRYGSSIAVLLELDRGATRAEVEATAPSTQLGAAKPRSHRGRVVLARTMLTDVKAGQSKLVLPLDARARRVLRHGRRLRLTLTLTIVAPDGQHEKAARTFVLV